jgi:hypothetical protein
MVLDIVGDSREYNFEKQALKAGKLCAWNKWRR